MAVNKTNFHMKKQEKIYLRRNNETSKKHTQREIEEIEEIKRRPFVT